MFLPLELSLRPSRIFASVLAVAHGLALTSIWLAALPVWVRLLLTLALAAGAVRWWRKSLRLPKGLRISQSGQVELYDGTWQLVSLQGQPVVLPWYVSLRLADEGGKTWQLTLLPDSTQPQAYRRLRVWLKWAGAD